MHALAERVSILSRLVLCYANLGRDEKAGCLQEDIAELVEHLTLAEICQDPYLFEAVAVFMDNDLLLLRRKADANVATGFNMEARS